MDKLRSMRVVVAIADAGSLTAAAACLNTSLPTVVRELAATELRLGVRLFERTTRQLHITEEGSLFVESSRRILSEVSEIEDVLQDRRTEPAGLIAITAPVLFGRLHVAPVLNSFLRQYPHVSARLVLMDRVVDLIEEGIDVAVRIGPVTAPDLVVTAVGAVRRCLCASPALLDATGFINQPNELRQAPFIRVAGLLPNRRLTFKYGDTFQEVDASNIRLTTNHADAAVLACIDGIGVGMFLSYQVQDAVSTGKLRIILETSELDPLPVSLVYSPTKRVSARARAFISWAKLHLRERLENHTGGTNGFH
jgi:DNA-binding transcriptional LysR family regulator